MQKKPDKLVGTIMVDKPLERISIFRGILSIFLVVLLFFIFSYCVHHDAVIVTGSSMQPTINSDSDNRTTYDIVFVNKVADFKRGDIVIVDFEDYSSKYPRIIKRVIATEGDTVNIKWDEENQKLLVYLKKAGENEFSLLEESYIKKDPNYPSKDDPGAIACATSFASKSGWEIDPQYINADGSVTIPKGYFFFLGDNRGESWDGSEVGPLSTNRILGVVDTIVPNGTLLNTILKEVFGLKLND